MPEFGCSKADPLEYADNLAASQPAPAPAEVEVGDAVFHFHIQSFRRQAAGSDAAAFLLQLGCQKGAEGRFEELHLVFSLRSVLQATTSWASLVK